MAEDDIVQKITIEVEGEDQAQSALDKIGESASTSFEQLQKAAATAGVSIEQFGQLSEKTQAQYGELSQRVEQASQQIVQSTQEVQQAAAGAGQGTQQLGGGLDEVSEKSGVSSREMRGLGKIMKELGAGEAAGLAVSFSKVASSLGALGVAALGLAMAIGSLTKFAKEATDAAKAMDSLAAASGTPVESLKAMEGAFESAGGSAKKFAETFKDLTLTLAQEAPKIGEQVAESAKKVLDAQAALAKVGFDDSKLRLQTQQLALQGQELQQTSQKLGFQNQQLQLQGQQLAQNLQSVQRQLQYASQLADIESRKTNLSVKDAASNLEKLELQDRYLRGKISEASYARQMAALERDERDRAIQKARIDLEEAKLKQEQLPAEQRAKKEQLEMQKASLELQQQQLPMQQRGLELQEEANRLAKEKLELDKKIHEIDLSQANKRLELEKIIALAKANEALANSLKPAIEAYQKLASGQKAALPLDMEARLTALKAFMVGFTGSLDQLLPALARMADKMTGLQKLFLAADLKKLGFSDELIANLLKGSEAFAKLQKDAAGLAWARKEVEDWGKAADITGIKFKNFGIILAAIGIELTKIVLAPIVAYFTGGITFALDTLRRALIHALGTPVANAWKWIADKFNDVLTWINEKIEQAKALIEKWITTPVADAWKWIKDIWDAIGNWIDEKIAQAKTLIEAWVTTPVANAWQWINDTAASVWEQVKTSAQQAYQSVVEFVTKPVAAAWQWIKDAWNANVPKFAQFGGGGTVTAEGHAAGGEIRGRSGTDTNLAWLTAGEFVMSTAAVGKYGLAMMHAINSLQAPRFALGGLNIGRPSLGSIGAFAGGGMHNVTIAFPGLPDITGLRASPGVVDELRHAAAMAQVRSGGRKPSRYS